MDPGVIVIATDFSASGAAAFAAAADLAGSTSAELHVVHVAERLLRSTPGEPGSGGPDTSRPENEQLESRLLQWVAERGAQERHVRAALLEGDPAGEILGYARRQGAGLIVLGRHGHSAIERFFVGSTAEEVMRKAPCPVLVVPPPSAEAPGAPSARP